jgi:hypothetical protein
MKIYLSEFDEVIDLIQNVSEESNIDVFRSGDFEGYDTIEDRIRQSNLLIALIDEYWMSSTWKLHELFYAAGRTDAMGTIKVPVTEVATTAYLFRDTKNPWLNSLHNTLIIRNNLEKLKEHLDKSGEC